MIDVPTSTLPVSSRQLKRLMDICIALPLLVLATPALIIVSIALWISSGHPVLFKQTRIGEGGKAFTMYKFRTMDPTVKMPVQGLNGGAHKSPDDPRVTKIGRFLRKTSLDEIPQLVNVLLGDMSMVGPRPELPWIVEGYQPWQLDRLTVPQGLTGWWQINGRSKNPLHENVDLDIFYVRNYSLTLDLIILARTPWAIISGEGAF